MEPYKALKIRTKSGFPENPMLWVCLFETAILKPPKQCAALASIKRTSRGNWSAALVTFGGFRLNQVGTC